MAPKAKVKAKAKAKAAARVRHRPAMAAAGHRRGLLRMRRPAVAVPGDQEVAWGLGHLTPLHRVSLDDMRLGSLLVLEEAEYFGAKVRLAGNLRKVEVEPGEKYLMIHPTGTDSEDILKVFTSDPGIPFRIHVCQAQCDKMETGDRLLHADRGRLGQDVGEPAWVHSLEGVGHPVAPGDQLHGLRQRALLVDPGSAPGPSGGERPMGADDPGDIEAKRTKKAKKKEKKERREQDRVLNGKRPSRAVQKDHQAMFQGTGLDSRDKVRRRVLRRAKKYASKKRARSSSSSDSGSSSSSSTVDPQPLESESVFLEESKARTIAERCPGALAMEGIASMRRALLSRMVGSVRWRCSTTGAS